MADDQKTPQDDKTGKGKSSLIKADPSRSNEDYIKEAEKYYIIPKLVRDVFPDLVKLIFETESMDIDEREYWLQILPIMTEDQIKKFRDILVNEKDQLKKLDKEYESEMSSLENKHQKVLNEEEIRRNREELKSKEDAAEVTEAKTEEELLKQLGNL
ncbi:MAG: hypothetical protein WC604_04835 [Candidatus Gracilibacteria bacterium]